MRTGAAPPSPPAGRPNSQNCQPHLPAAQQLQQLQQHQLAARHARHLLAPPQPLKPANFQSVAVHKTSADGSQHHHHHHHHHYHHNHNHSHNHNHNNHLLAVARLPSVPQPFESDEPGELAAVSPRAPGHLSESASEAEQVAERAFRRLQAPRSSESMLDSWRQAWPADQCRPRVSSVSTGAYCRPTFLVTPAVSSASGSSGSSPVPQPLGGHLERPISRSSSLSTSALARPGGPLQADSKPFAASAGAEAHGWCAEPGGRHATGSAGSSSHNLHQAHLSPLANINLEQYISKRNERERSRVRHVNDAFENLKNNLPLNSDRLRKRMSKVEILRTAIGYIRDLEDLLGLEAHEAAGRLHSPGGQPAHQLDLYPDNMQLMMSQLQAEYDNELARFGSPDEHGANQR